MNNKSYIQLQIEQIQTKGRLEKDIKDILEKYNVKDAVFGIINNTTQELSCGYLVEEKRFDNLSLYFNISFKCR